MSGQRSERSRLRRSHGGNGGKTRGDQLRESKRRKCGQKRWREISAEGLRRQAGRSGIWQLRCHCELVEEQFWEKMWNQDCLRRMLGPPFFPMSYTSHSPPDSHGAKTYIISVQFACEDQTDLCLVSGSSSLIKDMKIKHFLQRKKGV